ncbi:MAG: TetR/AcrR family transcriptional regulator [Thalassolituus oleivorans]|nr:TetR/AcrR family transcriptional regulator [Thalassolituus oleivorans]|tara:strand:+ start:545 stop:1150 length:606 start_codon:yes stop_codon:yes gene_type:complete
MLKKSKPNYHHGNLREQLVSTALKHLRNEGVEQLSLRALARELGVSQTAPYRHFIDKNALLAALAHEGFLTLTQAMTEAVTRHPDNVAAQLQQAGVAYIGFARAFPELYRLMFGQPLIDISKYPDLQASGNATFNILKTIVATCIEQGVIKGKETEMLANTAWALVHGLAKLILDRLQYQVSEEFIQQQIDIATRQMFSVK